MEPSKPIFTDRLWCVVPVFNNGRSVEKVAKACLAHCRNVVVVDDGSTDANLLEMFSGSDIVVLQHETNRGKGAAILTAFAYVRDHDGVYMITIDGDGQHDPNDIPAFLPLLDDRCERIIIGQRDFSSLEVPGRSRFGRAFSDFWVKLETGVDSKDSQSGFRAYPIKLLSGVRTRFDHYGFELEILTRALWAGFALHAVDVSVCYSPSSGYVSHFHPLRDNLRISLVHTALVCRRLTPFPHRRLAGKNKINVSILLHPRILIRSLLKENVTPSGLAASAAVGIVLGVLPLISLHSLAIIYVTARLNLNKLMALSIQHLCVPPLVPLACIELGHYMLRGCWLTEATRHTIVDQLPSRLLEWFVGSLIVAPLAAAIVALVVYLIARQLTNREHSDAQ